MTEEVGEKKGKWRVGNGRKGTGRTGWEGRCSGGAGGARARDSVRRPARALPRAATTRRVPQPLQNSPTVSKEHPCPRNQVIPLLLLLLLLLSHFSRVRLCATPETIAHQAPPSLGFSRQEHWSGLPFPSPSYTTGGAEDTELNKAHTLFPQKGVLPPTWVWSPVWETHRGLGLLFMSASGLGGKT